MRPERVIVYLVNEHPFYMRMVAQSISMLRQHNKTEKVRLLLVEDGAEATVVRDGMVAGISRKWLVNLCGRLGVEVVTRPPLSIPGEERYFYIHRHYLKDMEEPTVVYIDGDTFIFGDVAPLIERYSDVGFSGSDNAWVWSQGFTPAMLPIRPFNSGVMVWNEGWCQKWAAQLPELSAEIRTGDAPLSAWLRARHPQCLGREEFSVTLFVVRNTVTYKYICDDDCWLIRGPECLKRVGKSTIFHSYTDHWRETLGQITAQDKQRRTFKYVRKAKNERTTTSAQQEADHPAAVATNEHALPDDYG